MNDSTNNPPQHGFSVATLMLLIAVAAIGLAAVETAWLKIDRLDRSRASASYWAPSAHSPFEERIESLAWQVTAGAIVGMVAGIGVGAMRPRPFLAILLATPVGMFAGALAAAVLTDPDNVLLVVVGSAVLILLGVVVRALSHRPR